VAPNRYYTSDAVPTTLAASLLSVTPGATGSVQVASITGYPVSFPFTLLLDWGTSSQEVVTVTQAATGSGPYTYAACVRGDDGTLAPAHTAPMATVVHGVSARDFTDPQTHLGSSSGVHGVTGALAPLASPAFTGTPTAPTASPLTSSIQLATTAYTDSAVTAGQPSTGTPLALTKGGTGQDAASGTALLTALGAGTAALQASTAFDAAGAAAAAQAASTPVLTQATVLTASGTASANTIVPVNTTSGNVTVTLPSAPPAGTMVAVKHIIQGGSNTVTIACAGTDVLDKAGGSTSSTLTLASQGKLLQYGSGIWVNLADDLPLTQLDARYDALGAAALALPLAGGTVTGNVAIKGGRPWFDVVAFGADPTGATDSTSAIQAAVNAATGAANPQTTARQATGPVYIPAGSYKISSDILIQSVSGFHLLGAGANQTTLQATGSTWTTAVVNINGSLDGMYGGFQITSASGNNFPIGLNLTYTGPYALTPPAMPASGVNATNTNPGIPVTVVISAAGATITNVLVNGVSAGTTAGTYTVPISGTISVTYTGGPPTWAWTNPPGVSRSTSANKLHDIRVRGYFVTGVALAGVGTYQLDGTVLENIVVSGQNYAPWSSSGNWQYGVVFGNGNSGNIYDQVAYNVTVGSCYYGYYCNDSSFALWGAQPAGNAIDFWIEPSAQITVENVQSQVSGQFIVCPAGQVKPVSFRDCQFASYTGLSATYPAAWISIGTSYGGWVFENVWNVSVLQSTPPVINLGAGHGSYGQGFTLIGCGQNNPPSAGIVPGTSVPVVAINYIDTTSGRVPYPLYAINAGVLYQQGVIASRPAATTYGEGFYYATDTSALSRSNGTAWTSLSLAPTAPQVNFFTASGTWTKPAGAQTAFAAVLGCAGGAGSGASGTSGTVQIGGGGGGTGAYLTRQFIASDLPSTVTVTIGAGGTGGSSVTASTRVDTTAGGTNTTTTVTDANAVTGDLGRSISGTNIPANAYITAVNAGVGYTISAAATGGVTSSITFTIGANMIGNPGTAGAACSFGTYLNSQGGGQGAGGTFTAVAAAGGYGQWGAGTQLGYGAASSASGGAGVGISSPITGPPGGSSGAGITTGGVASNGAAGGKSPYSNDAIAGAAGVVGGASPTSGTASGITNGSMGPAPGSGASSITGAAQAGANALANSGAGGAGGGASLNGNASGAGGNGGSGWVLVVAYFQ